MFGWIVTAVLFLTILVAAFVVWRNWRRCLAQMDAFQLEDQERASRRRRVFEVLHTLGDAILEGKPDSTIHRLICEGAVNVVEAQGAVIYLLDETGKSLVPRHCTKNCPPLIALPERIISQAQTNPATLPSFLRLHSIAPGEGALGEVFTTQSEANIDDLLHHPKFNGESNPFQKHIKVLIAPLRYGKRALGVMAAANAGGIKFSQHALEMFVALAEQCGFALGSAQAHKEASAKKSIEAELRNASEIQQILLPANAPEMSSFEIAGHNVPAKLVSGDYYDFFRVNASHIGIAIADVCGKGIPAALITAMCRSVLRANARENLSPAAVLAAVNRNLFPDIRQDMFITAAYIVAAADTGTITLARAGHTTPYLWRKESGAVEEISVSGLAIGIDKGEVFERATKDVSVTMHSGDVLLLYTDGVNEATDHKDLLFGEDRIKQVLAETAPQGPKSVVDAISRAVETFMGGEQQSDDITLVAMRKK